MVSRGYVFGNTKTKTSQTFPQNPNRNCQTSLALPELSKRQQVSRLANVAFWRKNWNGQQTITMARCPLLRILVWENSPKIQLLDFAATFYLFDELRW
jgi:hypothetical protein